MSIDVYRSILHLDTVTGKSDDALDKTSLWIQWKVKDDNIAPLRVLQGIGQLIDHHKLAIQQAGLHAVPFNPDACRKHIDHHKENDCENNSLENGAQKSQNPPRDTGWLWLSQRRLRGLIEGVVSHGLDYKTRYRG